MLGDGSIVPLILNTDQTGLSLSCSNRFTYRIGPQNGDEVKNSLCSRTDVSEDHASVLRVTVWALKVETVCPSKTSIPTYHRTRHHNL